MENRLIIEKITEIITKSCVCSDITKRVHEQDPKIHYGMKDGPKELYFITQVAGIPDPLEMDDCPDFGDEKLEKEFLSFKKVLSKTPVYDTLHYHFENHFFSESEKQTISNVGKEGVISFSGTFSCPKITKGSVSVMFNQKLLLETSDPAELSVIFAHLSKRQVKLKEEDLQKTQSNFLELQVL